MHHHEPDCLPKRLVWCLQGQGTVKDHTIKVWLSNVSSELLILLQLNLELWHITTSWIVVWKDFGLLCCGQDHRNGSKSEWMFTGQYLLNCWTFCNQTWYGDAPSRARVSCKKLGLLSSSSRSRWCLILSNNYDCFFHICWTAELFATKFNSVVHHY